MIPTPSSRLRRRSHGERVSTLVLALPTILVFGLFAWWPILRTGVMAFQTTNFVNVARWVGGRNFERVFADPHLSTAVANTVWFMVLSLVIGGPLPLILATFISELRRSRGLASALAYLPVILPPVVTVLLWKEFYDPGTTGLFNTVLGWLGLSPVPWLQTTTTAMPSIVVQSVWAGFGTATVIYLAALRGVNVEVYEAAEVDGAGVLRRVWHFTLPQLRGVVLILLLLQVIGAFQVFTEPFIMTSGGPNRSTTTIMMLIYQYAFVSGDFGKAAALSLMLAGALCLLSGVYLVATRRWSTDS